MPLPLNEFADRLSQIMPVILKEFSRYQVVELYKGKITFPQFLVLNYLHISEEPKMKDLALFMRVTTAAITGTVERLVRDNYVVRVLDPGDRRIIKVRLTAKGNELVRKVKEQRRQMIIKIFGKVCENDRREYLRILMQIQDILTAENRDKP